MRQWNAKLALVVCVCLSFAAVLAADATPTPGTPPAPGGGAGGGGGGRGNFDPAAFRAQMQTRLKEQLGATDDEWKVLQPKLDEVQKIRDEQRNAGRGMFGGGRRGGGNAAPVDEATKSDLQKKTDALKALLDNKESDPKAIQDALKALRDEREKAKAALKKSQDGLKELLTAKQEATLVLYGTLE